MGVVRSVKLGVSLIGLGAVFLRYGHDMGMSSVPLIRLYIINAGIHSGQASWTTFGRRGGE